MALLSMPLDERVLVCGQLSAREISVVEPMGVSCVVNNRPDSELGFFQTKSAKLERAARQSGVAYLHLPFSGDDLSADQVAAFRQAGREDLAQRESAEIAVLQAYLPARLSADEIAAAVQALVTEVATELGRPPAAGDMGRLMAAAKAQLAGRADMAQVSAAVKAALAG